MQSLSSRVDLSSPQNDAPGGFAGSGSSMPAAQQAQESIASAGGIGRDGGVAAGSGPFYAPSLAAGSAPAISAPLASTIAPQPGVNQGPQILPTGPVVLATPTVAPPVTALAPVNPTVPAAPTVLAAASPSGTTPGGLSLAAAPANVAEPQVATANPPASQPVVAGASPPATPLSGASPQNPLMPANNGSGGDILTCAAPNCLGQGWTYFDPKVAIGYDFQLLPSGLTSPSVGVTDIRVSTLVGDGDYQLYLLDTQGDWIDVAPIDANPDGIAADDFNVALFLGALTLAEDQEFGITDPADGLTQFSIRGIDPAAGLDPNDPQAFIAGLEFSDWFQGSVLITPLVLDTATGIDPPGASFETAVPEPPMLPVFGAGLLGMALLRRRARPAVRARI